MKLEPPDLSSFIRTKLSSSEFSASRSAGTSSHPFGLPKSAEMIDHSSLSNGTVQEQVDGSLLTHLSSKTEQNFPRIMALIQNLGLPQDTLSSSIISFFTFFSLPLDAQVLKQIRRDVLRSQLLNEKAAGKSANSTALAASAAFDKGVSLSDEALKEYAAAIDPSERNGSQEHKGAFQNGGSDEPGSEQSGDENRQKQDTGEKNTPLPEDMKNLIDKIDANGSLLGFLNKISGKNGQKWIVLPFNFTSGTTEFSVSLRILLSTSDVYHIVERLAVDAQVDEHRWVFLISKENNNTYRAQIAVPLDVTKREQSSFLPELKEMLENFVSNISFIDENALLSFIDSRNDSIISVNEEV